MHLRLHGQGIGPCVGTAIVGIRLQALLQTPNVVLLKLYAKAYVHGYGHTVYQESRTKPKDANKRVFLSRSDPCMQA